jgi:hypothetical protein
MRAMAFNLNAANGAVLMMVGVSFGGALLIKREPERSRVSSTESSQKCHAAAAQTVRWRILRLQ